MFLSILHHCSLQCFCYSSFLEVWRGELFLGGAHLPKFTQGVCTRSSGFGSHQIRSSEAGVSAASACCMRICVWRMPRSIRTASGVHIGWKQACAVHLRVSPVQPVGCWLMSGSMRYQHYLGFFPLPFVHYHGRAAAAAVHIVSRVSLSALLCWLLVETARRPLPLKPQAVYGSRLTVPS